MRCAIMQPTYIPWLGYFDLMKQVDVFVILDNVKLEKSSWHVRNRIRSSQGETMLTIPVSLKNGRLDTFINQTEINYKKPWSKKHLRSIEQCYSKSDYFNQFEPYLKKIISKKENFLSVFTSNIIREMAKYFGIDTPIYFASDLDNISGQKADRLVSICKNFNTEIYYSPKGSSAYLDKENYGGALSKAGIKVVYQNFMSVEYKQRYSPFIPFLSAIDAAFNCSPDEVLKLIDEGCLTEW